MKDLIFTDAWCPGIGEQEVSEGELLAGELSAVTFEVGCYIVRSALRVYTIHDQDWYLPEPEKPAGEEDVATVKKDLRWNERAGKIIGADGSIFASWKKTGTYREHFPSWKNKLRITQEISARHNSNPDKPFTYICRASNPINGTWYEYIGDIYTVKENDNVPDSGASLLIYFVFISDLYGIDTWYRFDPDGGITTSSMS